MELSDLTGCANSRMEADVTLFHVHLWAVALLVGEKLIG
jgi:hypothetical protein